MTVLLLITTATSVDTAHYYFTTTSSLILSTPEFSEDLLSHLLSDSEYFSSKLLQICLFVTWDSTEDLFHETTGDTLMERKKEEHGMHWRLTSKQVCSKEGMSKELWIFFAQNVTDTLHQICYTLSSVPIFHPLCPSFSQVGSQRKNWKGGWKF